MKKFFKTILYILIFIILILILIPKQNIFFYVENELKKYDLIFSEETLEEKSFGLEIKNSKVYYNKTFMGIINNIDINTFIISNTINIDKINIDKSFKNLIPIDIEKIHINHNITNPLNININIYSKLGDIVGNYNILNKRLILFLKNSNKIKRKDKLLLKRFKTKDGNYKYEFKF